MGIKKLLFFFAITTTVIPSVAFAQTTTPTTTRGAMKQEIKEEHCTTVTNHITNLTNRLTNDDTIRQNRHQKVIDRLNAIIAKLEASNIDVTKLKADVAALIQKKNTWYSAYTTLLDDLNATKQYACGNSQGQFKTAVQTARTQRQTMHTANMDFWTYVENTVRPDLKAIRSQLKITPTP